MMTSKKKPSPPSSPTLANTSSVKTLTLIRHAKSSWKYAGLDDRDRPLNARGIRDAALMGMVLSQRGFSPELLTSSPALRALRTAEAVAAGIGYPDTAIVLNHHLYHAGSDGLLKRLHQFDDSLNWIALVGHNPGLTELVKLLVTAAPGDVPTGGVAEIRFDTRRWQDISRDKVVAFFFDRPKNHR